MALKYPDQWLGLKIQFIWITMESHCCPQEALSDAAQQLTPQALAELLNTLNVLIE